MRIENKKYIIFLLSSVFFHTFINAMEEEEKAPNKAELSQGIVIVRFREPSFFNQHLKRIFSSEEPIKVTHISLENLNSFKQKGKGSNLSVDLQEKKNELDWLCDNIEHGNVDVDLAEEEADTWFKKIFDNKKRNVGLLTAKLFKNMTEEGKWGEWLKKRPMSECVIVVRENSFFSCPLRFISSGLIFSLVANECFKNKDFNSCKIVFMMGAIVGTFSPAVSYLMGLSGPFLILGNQLSISQKIISGVLMLSSPIISGLVGYSAIHDINHMPYVQSKLGLSVYDKNDTEVKVETKIAELKKHCQENQGVFNHLAEKKAAAAAAVAAAEEAKEAAEEAAEEAEKEAAEAAKKAAEEAKKAEKAVEKAIKKAVEAEKEVEKAVKEVEKAEKEVEKAEKEVEKAEKEVVEAKKKEVEKAVEVVVEAVVVLEKNKKKCDITKAVNKLNDCYEALVKGKQEKKGAEELKTIIKNEKDNQEKAYKELWYWATGTYANKVPVDLKNMFAEDKYNKLVEAFKKAENQRPWLWTGYHFLLFPGVLTFVSCFLLKCLIGGGADNSSLWGNADALNMIGKTSFFENLQNKIGKNAITLASLVGMFGGSVILGREMRKREDKIVIERVLREIKLGNINNDEDPKAHDSFWQKCTKIIFSLPALGLALFVVGGIGANYSFGKN